MELFYVLIGATLVVGAYLMVAGRWSFTAQAPADYAGVGPQFDIRQHLNGPILCEGIIYGPTGRVTSRFVADLTPNGTEIQG